MRARVVSGVSVLAMVAALAGCGGSNTTAAFKSGYEALRGPLNDTGTAIGSEIDQAPKQTDAQVGAAFKQLAGRFQSQLAELDRLKPPADLRADFSTLTGAAARLEADLNDVVSAAATHNASAAEKAGGAIVEDAEALKTAAAPIKSKLGIK